MELLSTLWAAPDYSGRSWAAHSPYITLHMHAVPRPRRWRRDEPDRLALVTPPLGFVWGVSRIIGESIAGFCGSLRAGRDPFSW